ncbi:MAG: hypothetical protein COB17_03405 [Sulfurimonas sp.]|nr:MAG: hypothetical protein COB17_03405 [Sulfurimonas sp.]
MKELKASYIFNTIAIALIIISIVMFFVYKDTKNKIVNISYNDNLSYVESISENISNDILDVIKKDFYISLYDDKVSQDYINTTLSLFVTKKFKYIYLIDKEYNHFRFLADGSLIDDEKSEFGESYQPFQVSEWDKIYKNKKPIFFTHSKFNNIWTTYLNPIIINDKIEAILVIDFSLQEHDKIEETLLVLDNMLMIASSFLIIIFILILWFSHIDKKRENQKNIVFDMLIAESKKVQDLNLNLASQVEEEVNKNRAKDQQLLQQSRLAQMGEMISMIAHQWRQPLSVISAVAISLNIKAELGTADKSTVIDFSKRISEYSKHLSSTIDDFRDFFKPNKEKENTSFNYLIESVLRIVEIEITTNNIYILKHLKCHNEFDSYANELKQVILNILKNSQDILLENKIQDPFIKILTYSTEENLILEISDNGGGIPDDIITKIFDPYFSTKLDKNGTGIGLYMSKIIVEEHCSGKLNVKNNKDGVMFKIKIPHNDTISNANSKLF